LFVITSGLPAAGKSTLARALSGPLPVTLIALHMVRRYLPLGPDMYSVEANREVHCTAFARAEEMLLTGKSVVLDAMFIKRYYREQAYELASRCSAELIVMHCVCDDLAVVTERINARLSATDDVAAEGNKMDYYWRSVNILDPLEDDIYPTGLTVLIFRVDTNDKSVILDRSLCETAISTKTKEHVLDVMEHLGYHRR
jgi:predicted kinase